ncbi:MAG: hypothetical protein K8S20_13830 [Chloroflexi bacterium]|nr:hypothetical protein [Chloroflexota bacterium]
MDNYREKGNLTINRNLHFLFIVFFLAVSIFLTLGRVGTAFKSFALLTPDLGVYASLAAAQEQPELFTRDPFLSNQENTNSYTMVHLPLIKLLKRSFGNYGTACAFLLAFFIFIHLTGYYVLGITIFKNPWAGMLVSLLISTPLITYYDFWGIILDALPRFLYQGLIPFLLALSILHGNNPKWWPWIMGGLGLLNYVHPLSTPTWAISFMLALWLSAHDTGFWKKARMMTLAIAVLVVILLPFLMNYIGSTVTEAQNVVQYDQAITILRARFSTMSSPNPLVILLNFFVSNRGILLNLIWYFVCGLGLAGVVHGLTSRRPSSEHAHMLQISAWMTGVLIASVLLPVIEQAIFARLKQIPPEFELLRTLRYMIPLILLSAFYALWMGRDYLQQRLPPDSTLPTRLLVAASLVLVIAWSIWGPTQQRDFRQVVRQNITCWTQARIVCDLPQKSMDFIGVLDAVREKTPIGARIFSEGQEVAVRYYALRPLVYTYKDGAPLAYTDPGQLLIWSEQHEAMDKLAFIRKFPFRRNGFIRGIVELAEKAGSEYLILAEPYDSSLFYPDSLSLVYSNGNYSLYSVNPE